MAKFESNSRPLGAIYLLAPRTASANAPRIEDVSAREALLELVQNTYMNGVLDRNRRAAEFDVISRVVMQVPVRRIVPHVDLTTIGVLCDLIVADTDRLFATLRSTAAPSKD
jgi:hypothetical protein